MLNNIKLSKAEVKDLLKKYYRTKDKILREKLILHHQELVANFVRKFSSRGEFEKDLIQVGMIGLIQAIDRFNPNRGVEFISFAAPTIAGELKRYIRDKRWSVKVPRKLQELNFSISQAVDKLTQELGHSPTIPELANYLNASEEQILEAMEISQAYNPVSLDATISSETEDKAPVTLLDLAGKIDKKIELLDDRNLLKDVLKILTSQERAIIILRFYENCTQGQIAKKLKISQMQVSRLQNKALRKMRHYIQLKNHF